MTATATLTSTTMSEKRDAVEAHATRQNRLMFGGMALIAIYFIASFIQFDIGSIAQKWNPTRASLFVLDTYAHKDHISMKWKEPGNVEASFEGGWRHVYKTPPPWLQQGADGAQTVTFNSGSTITFFNDRVVMTHEDFSKPLTFKVNAQGKPYIEGYESSQAGLPGWIRVSESKVEVRPSLYERLQVYKSKAEVHRYSVGWKYFWFDFDSKLRDYGLFGALGLAFSGDRLDPAQSNFSFAIQEFLNNEIWQHGTVLFSLVETILMALLGTMIASIVSLPLAFMAAKNITPLAGLRFALRRLFDFLRGIDVLIWCLIFLRAFGPGLFTGIFAIAFTDTGTLGKLFSEAIENTDKNQKEGVQSTGANKVQQHRFGIVPQILPVFISQSLYYLESNTRGAVIIGAMGAGGIGLQFLGALQTGNDFENVAYMAIIILITVILMDTLSAKLRRALIGIKD